MSSWTARRRRVFRRMLAIMLLPISACAWEAGRNFEIVMDRADQRQSDQITVVQECFQVVVRECGLSPENLLSAPGTVEWTAVYYHSTAGFRMTATVFRDEIGISFRQHNSDSDPAEARKALLRFCDELNMRGFIERTREGESAEEALWHGAPRGYYRIHHSEEWGFARV